MLSLFSYCDGYRYKRRSDQCAMVQELSVAFERQLHYLNFKKLKLRDKHLFSTLPRFELNLHTVTCCLVT
jgi:hypothetical protein